MMDENLANPGEPNTGVSETGDNATARIIPPTLGDSSDLIALGVTSLSENGEGSEASPGVSDSRGAASHAAAERDEGRHARVRPDAYWIGDDNGGGNCENDNLVNFSGDFVCF